MSNGKRRSVRRDKIRGRRSRETAPPLSFSTTRSSEMPKTILQRFNEKWILHPYTGCWIWTAHIASSGYGKIRHQGRIKRAHRLSYELHIGPIPEGGGYYETLCVCHHCDNPTCVNPDHLFIGSQADNLRDMADKGRGAPPFGENHGRSKLTESDVIAIRSDSRSLRAIAADYHIRHSTVGDIRLRKTWRHLA